MSKSLKLKSCGQKNGYSSSSSLTSNNTKAPSAKYNKPHDETTIYRPIFSQSTLVENDIDVMWDWNSPQSKRPFLKTKRNETLQHSPKLPIKRLPSNSQLPEFNKLKEELETLTDQITEENCTKLKPKFLLNDLEDMFNDSMEDALVFCSQQVEQDLCTKTKSPFNINNYSDHNGIDKNKMNSGTVPSNDLAQSKEDSLTSNPKEKCDRLSNKIVDDSFDAILGNLKDEDFRVGDQVEAADVPNFGNVHINGTNQYFDGSPIKCSPEEIEHKRLQALAKLEAKKLQDVIERNRQEALKRLEKSRKRRAGTTTTHTNIIS